MKRRLNFILLNGPIGSGKSTIGNLLAKKLQRTAILEIEDIRRLIPGKEDNQLAWKIIHRMCDEYFKNGISVLLKQSVASHDIVNMFLRLARKYKCRIRFYHLQAPGEILLKRIDKRKMLNISKALVSNNIRKHKKISYPNAAIIDTSRMKPRDATKLILSD